jgi:hypothetical protein
MRFRPVVTAVAATISPVLASAQAVGGPGSRVIDEGTFLITRTGGPPETENFKITRGANGLIVATGQLSAGGERISSSLTADSSGTPVDYELSVLNNRVQTVHVHAGARGGRLSSLSSDQHGNEAMREYPIPPGGCLILDDDLPHQTYFVALARRSGSVQVVNPRGGRAASLMLTPRGFEPVKVADRTVTATHYVLGSGQSHREFWVDAAGRLLRVEIPARGIVAVRDELPK